MRVLVALAFGCFATGAMGAEYWNAIPGPACDSAEPLISRGRYVPVKDGIYGLEIFKIANGSKVSVCGAPVKGFFYISFTGPDGRDYTGWVGAEYVR